MVAPLSKKRCFHWVVHVITLPYRQAAHPAPTKIYHSMRNVSVWALEGLELFCSKTSMLLLPGHHHALSLDSAVLTWPSLGIFQDSPKASPVPHDWYVIQVVHNTLFNCGSINPGNYECSFYFGTCTSLVRRFSCLMTVLQIQHLTLFYDCWKTSACMCM